jgi:cytidylate kinase
MDHRPSERLAYALDRLHRQLQAEREAITTPGNFLGRSPAAFTVALSRQAGANGSPVARSVGERLGWNIYDRELLQQIADDMGVRSTLLETVDERHQSWLLECLESLGPASGVSQPGYVRHLVETLVSLAWHGQCVIVGRGAAQLLPAATTLRVRLVGSLSDRIKVMGARMTISQAEAEKLVQKIDRERFGFVPDHFHRDSTDPDGYDLVLNSSRFNILECSDLIIEALHRLQKHAPDATASRP